MWTNLLHEFWFGYSVKRHLDTQLNKLQVENVDSNMESVSEFKVELSDDTGFADASWCQEFEGDVADHITQDDVRFHLKSGKWILITISVNNKSRKQFSEISLTLTQQQVQSCFGWQCSK